MSNYCNNGRHEEESAAATLSSGSSTFPTTQSKFQVRRQIRKELHDALHQDFESGIDSSIDWNSVHGLLVKLLKHPAVANASSPEQRYASPEEDPLGRIFLTRLLSRNPPLECLNLALNIFPDSISPSNPVAYFTACSHASLEVMESMMRHNTTDRMDHSDTNECCPYPWILSSFISLEACQSMLQVYPQGVLEKPSAETASFLTSENMTYSPLEYVLFSPAMIAKREFDETLWQKFKLMMVTAECLSENGGSVRGVGCQISPVHTILDKILAYPDFFESTERAQHVFWLLHQLRNSDEWVFQKQRPQENGENLFPLHLVLSKKCPASSQQALAVARVLCKVLLEADCLAAMEGISGGELYPLHMAVENGWPCHDLLLSVWPESIEMKDPRTGLLPFQSALATSSTESATDNMCLDVAFELLRANPTITGSCGSSDTAVLMDTEPVNAGSSIVEGKA